MNQRERLIGWIMDSVGGCARHWAEVIADGILERGGLAPPCKVGDTVYILDCIKTYPREADVLGLALNSDNRLRIKIMYKEYPFCQAWFDGRLVNRTIFLSREEAEQALKEREPNEA